MVIGGIRGTVLDLEKLESEEMLATVYTAQEPSIFIWNTVLVMIKMAAILQLMFGPVFTSLLRHPLV